MRKFEYETRSMKSGFFFYLKKKNWRMHLESLNVSLILKFLASFHSSLACHYFTCI